MGTTVFGVERGESGWPDTVRTAVRHGSCAMGGTPLISTGRAMPPRNLLDSEVVVVCGLKFERYRDRLKSMHQVA